MCFSSLINRSDENYSDGCMWYMNNELIVDALSEMCIAAGGQPVVAAAAHNWICLQALSTMNIVAQVVVAAE
ncbi:hypothetical protein Tco_0664353 [Tanacetum coccineum]